MEFYYWLRDTTNPKFKTVNCIIKIDGDDSIDFSTKIKILKHQWNQKEQCFEGKNSSINEKDLKALERRLREIKDQIQLESPNAPINPNEVVQQHRNAKKSEKDQRTKKVVYFRDCMRDFLISEGKRAEHERIVDSTYEVANSRVKILMEYLNKQNLNRIRPLEINEAFLEKLKEDFIENGYSDSTIAKYQFFVKRVLKNARKKGLILYHNAQDYEVELPKEKDPIYVTSKELNRMIEAANGHESYQDTMDIYRFCCYTSLSYIDYHTLHAGNFDTDEDGTLWIYTSRDKTGTRQRIPLHQRAIDIIEKYEGIENLPKKSNQKLNKNIKIIAALAKVDKYLTFHSSRRFYVDYLLNEKKTDTIIIGEVVGWKDPLRMIKKYAIIDARTIKEKVL